MRVIKFRAWDEIAKQMILPTDIYGDVRNEFVLTLAGDVFLCKEDYNGNYCPPTLEVKAVINIVLMQYTGLQDENKKEIYEGDICRYQLDTFDQEILVGGIGIVEYHEWAFFVDSYPVTEVTEIIGNIYENPELVNEKQLVNQ